VGDSLFGIDVLSVQEVIRSHDLTPVPLAPSAIKGLINLRGNIVTAIDLRTKLEFPERVGDSLPMHVIVRAGDSVISLLVDDVGDVVDVNESEFEEAPLTLIAACRDLVRGVYKLPHRVLLAVDAQRLVAGESPGLTGAPASRQAA